MNKILKLGEILFKIVAMFVILPALLLEHLSEMKSFSKNNKDNSGDYIKKSFNGYPQPKHYGY